MKLEKIKSKDLIFTGEIEDDRTNTYLKLDDYDWMDYVLTTRFKTDKLGILDVKFEYVGFTMSFMEVTQLLNGITETVTYEYSTDIFKKYLIKYLEKHMSFWDSTYAFNGEDIVIEFFNEVVEVGKIREEDK